MDSSVGDLRFNTAHGKIAAVRCTISVASPCKFVTATGRKSLKPACRSWSSFAVDYPSLKRKARHSKSIYSVSLSNCTSSSTGWAGQIVVVKETILSKTGKKDNWKHFRCGWCVGCNPKQVCNAYYSESPPLREAIFGWNERLKKRLCPWIRRYRILFGISNLIDCGWKWGDIKEDWFKYSFSYMTCKSISQVGYTTYFHIFVVTKISVYTVCKNFLTSLQ